ncbi:MAG TPA: WG repeat-containing protein [Chryseolinea sp.]|nr:WG repeat-containing protein [Chryseolinea sp.]
MKGIQLVLKIVVLSGALLFHLSAVGQSPDFALKNIQKKKWDRAYVLLVKALDKDSLNVTAKYVLAQYFFSEDNPAFHLDSAYHHTLSALKDFQGTTRKQRDRLKRFPLDSISLTSLLEKIDSVAFQRAKAANTEMALADFVLHFPLSSYLNLAIDLRDSVAYADAVKKNNYDAFLHLMTLYPESKQFNRAREKYETLLFEDKTLDMTLNSYQNFLKNYPMTPYRSLIQQIIFEYQTASGEKEKFTDFIEAYPENPFTKKATDILFHLVPEPERAVKWGRYFSHDSLRTVMALEQNYMVPFLHNGKFGFMDKDGKEVIAALSDSIEYVYLCGNISDDVISLPDKLISRNGALIWQGNTTGMDDLGVGFLLIEEEDCRYVIHKSGFKISHGCVDNAKILSGKLIAVQQNDFWSVWTLAGRKLIHELDDVFSVKDVIVLKQNNKFKLATLRELTTLPFHFNLEDREQFDEVKSLPNDLVLTKVNDNYRLLNQLLETQIDLESRPLGPSFFGMTSASDSLNINVAGQPSKAIQVIAYDPWIAVKTDSSWRLFDSESAHLSSTYDSIIFSGPFAVAYKKDSLRTYFSGNNFIDWAYPVKAKVMPGQDSSAFMVLEERDVKSIYSRAGRPLFKATFDRIIYAGYGLFIVDKGGKKGLINIEGKLVLPMVYDAIGTADHGIVSVLKSMKFGLFDGIKKKLIKPEYDKNLTLYNANVISAYKNGFYGLITWDNQPLSRFEFNEIQFWNDSAAITKQGSQWMIYEIRTRDVLLDRIKKISVLADKPDKKLAIVQQGSSYGVLHNHKGTILPISFTDLKNVGSPDEPMYFTEKYVEEAAIFVVIYFDDEGKMLRKEVYEHDEYEKIYCPYN